MRLHVPVGRSLRRYALLMLLLIAGAASCAREVTAPGRGLRIMSRGISFLTRFPEALRDIAPGTSALVPVAKVRVVLYRADSTVALDTMVTFPDGTDSVTVSMEVPLSPSAPSTGEPLNMNLKYVSPAGDTVFRGAAPIVATAVTGTSGTGGTTPTPAQVTVTVTYTGTGATTKSVVISPRRQQVFIGQSFTWTANALDAGGNAVANTPIKWTSLDTAVASITNAATGVGTANKRGTARIVAELLTGPKDTVVLTVNAAASSVAAVSGDNQTGVVGQPLTNPLVVRVLGSDALPLAGTPITVTFGTGATAPVSQLTTDANGLATTTWTLGGTAGSQTATLAATGLSGSPVTFKATATPGVATALAATTNPPASVTAGQSLGNVQFTARDVFGNTATSFVGSVTVALAGGATGTGATGASLLGTTTSTANAGVVTFGGLQLTKVGTGYTLSATATGLTSATTNAVAVTPAAAVSLQFGTQPTNGTADGPIPTFVVHALDSYGNLATGFTTPVSLSLANTATTGVITAVLGGTVTATPVNGVATFNAARITRAGTGYQVSATASGVTAATSSAFAIAVGAPAVCTPVSATAQSYFVGALLPIAPMVQVADANGNMISGATVTFAANSGGLVGTASGVTGATATISSSWTLGSTVGAQTLTASCAGVTAPTTFTAAGRARGLTLNAGSEASIASASVAMAGTLTIPVVLDLTYPQGNTLASASFDIMFDSTKFSFVSSAVGTFGSVFENTSAASSGKVTVGVFSPTAATATTTLYTITLRPKSGAANTTSTVGLVATAAGNENAAAVPLAVRPLLVTIVP